MQAGVVSWRQLRDLGVPRHTLQRWLRGRHLVRVVRGVYVAHTGPVSGCQLAWVGVLFAAPAALSGPTAIQAALGREPSGTIELAVEHGRKLVVPAGFRVVRQAHLDRYVAWNTSPPRLRIEQAALDVAAAQDETYAAFETLAQVCREGATTADRLLAALEDRARIRGRIRLREMLYDVREGATSVLERGYLDLERSHGLPTATRRRREELGGIQVVRDADYEAFGLVVELDGAAYHNGRKHQDDLARDLLVLLDNRMTLRLGWHQVMEEGCATIAQIARVLAHRGWRGRPQPCSPGCALAGADAGSSVVEIGRTSYTRPPH